MNDFYSRTGDRRCHIEREEEAWFVPWVGGVAIAIVLAGMLVWSI